MSLWGDFSGRGYWANIWSVVKADGIQLDETEAAILGAPRGETISLWAAMARRHGVVLAAIACAIFSILIQWDHCHKQLIGAPMSGLDYFRATICLIVIPPGLGAVVAWGAICLARAAGLL
ncbi:hypothetical protein [Acidocella sp.]|uniref:hypothetical protein n=1 Tax=Acidocella sp. TaxID=50710 RepID=UPI00260DF86A|nr:hypothetical protein [Acidocella sp.]